LRILAYSDYYIASGHTGGSEVTLHETLLLLRAAGHTVDVLMARPFPTGEPSFAVDGIMVNAYSSKRDIEMYLPRYDVIIAHLGTVQRAWYLGLKAGIPVIQLVSNTTEYSTNIARKYGDLLIYNSYNTEKEIHADKPSVVMFPPVDPARYIIDSAGFYVTLVNLSDGAPPFFDKGGDIFYHLANEFPQYAFLGVQGAYGNQDLRPRHNVLTIEHQMNILEVYRQSSVVLMPSITESFGRISVEAACSGVPSLVSDLPGPREAGTAYKYVEPEDYDAWGTAFEELLADYNTASQQARDRANTLWTITQAQFTTLLKEIEDRYGR
jgi:glycosyltransferase involved in cell wall biosynthesis